MIEEVPVSARLEVLPHHREMDECIAWWRTKRRGGDPGFFPHGWALELPGDRPTGVRDVWAALPDRELGGPNEPRQEAPWRVDISTMSFSSFGGTTKTARDYWAEWGWDWALRLDDRVRAMYGRS